MVPPSPPSRHKHRRSRSLSPTLTVLCPSPAKLEREAVESQQRAIGIGRPGDASSLTIASLGLPTSSKPGVIIRECVVASGSSFSSTARFARESPLPSPDGSISSRSSTFARVHSRPLSFDTSASDPWYFDIPVRPVSCSNATIPELERSLSLEAPSLAGPPDDLDDSPPQSRTTPTRAVSLSMQHVRASLPSLSTAPPMAAPERATYRPGPGKRPRFASLPTAEVKRQPVPTQGRPQEAAVWWAASPAPAVPRSRARAATVVNGVAASPVLSTSGWMQVHNPLHPHGSPIIIRRSTSDPLPLPRTHGKTVLGASRRSSDLLPDDLMPIFSLASGQSLDVHDPGQQRSATAHTAHETISDRTAPEWARRSILDRLQPQDATIERILTEMSYVEPALRARGHTSPHAPLGKIRSVSPFLATRIAYRRTLLQLLISLGVLILVVAVGGSIAAVLNRPHTSARATAP